MATTGSEIVAPPEKDQVAVVDGLDKLAPPQANEEKPSKNVSEDHAKNVNASEVERPKMEASYVGWKQIGGWEEKDELTLEDELQDLSDETYLDNFLPDKLALW